MLIEMMGNNIGIDLVVAARPASCTVRYVYLHLNGRTTVVRYCTMQKVWRLQHVVSLANLTYFMFWISSLLSAVSVSVTRDESSRTDL
jgi:hypothetical protein